MLSHCAAAHLLGFQARMLHRLRHLHAHLLFALLIQCLHALAFRLPLVSQRGSLRLERARHLGHILLRLKRGQAPRRHFVAPEEDSCA
eukprot:scaffold2611_cov114-Isochrysis_galbana.AAC.2